MSESNFVDPSHLSATEKANNDQSNSPKKEKKKRKWGQDVGPIPKLIPPRKRAKTAAEKEQRALERVLRNRDAAEQSRKRKSDQRAMLENQRDSLQRFCKKLIEMNQALNELNPNNTVVKLESLPDYINREVLFSKPERTLMSDTEKKRADERAKEQELESLNLPTGVTLPPSPEPSPISQVSHTFNSSPELETLGAFSPSTEYTSEGAEMQSTGSARPTQHGGLFS
jgi:transcriptional activator HAC1